MVALLLLDHFLASGPSPDRSAEVALHLVHSALAELEQIESLDRHVAPEDPDEFDRKGASLLRGMYERWADETAELLERVGRLEQQISTTIHGADMLHHAYGRTRARLSISLDDMEQSLREAARGDTVTLEEVRRDLRARRSRS